MFKVHTLLAILLAASMAGCLGGGSDVDPESAANDAAGAGNETGAGASVDVSGNASVDDGNVSANATATWRYDNRTGTVSGAALVVTGPSEDETFDVVESESLTIDVGAEGTALNVLVLPPGCDESACAEASGSTGAGNVTHEVSAPEVGTWTIRLEPDDPGMADADYVVTIGVLVPMG